MVGLEYNSFCLCGRVRRMRSIPLLYSFVFVLASSFAVVPSAAAESRVSGFVFATDSCQLRPPAEAEACLAALVPVSGTLAVRRRGSVRRQVLALSDTGTFTTKLAPGRYNVRLLEGRSGNLILTRRELRLAPSVVSIPSNGQASRGSVYFAVSHRSRPETPFAGVSDGCEGK
jgi:hypothetical protein